MNIGVGSIITKGLGGPACNLLIFGAVRLFIEPINVTPTPTPTITPTQSVTPTVTPTPSVTPSVTPSTPPAGAGGHGGAFSRPYYDDDEEDIKYKLTFFVKFGKKNVQKSFIVDSFKKDMIVNRVTKINNISVKFKTTFKKLKNRFKVLWKK